MPDRRSVDATIRFYGLNRLPEELSDIGRTLPRQAGLGYAWPEEPGGVSPRQVQNLVRIALDELESHPLLPPPIGDGYHLPKLIDPFPDLWRENDGSRLRALWWAWAQIPDHQSTARIALLFYEYEHGLRPTAPMPTSRTERQRWRRLAWSVLDVASYRLSVAESKGSETAVRLVERSVGPRLVVLSDDATVGMQNSFREGLDALMQIQIGQGPLITLDAVERALECVRGVVRFGYPAASELLGMLRDAVSRRMDTKGPRSLPPEVMSKLFTMSTILARERRDPRGIAPAQWALDWGERIVVGANIAKDERAAVLSDTLRTAQELAELFDALGIHSRARLSLRRLRRLLQAFGDPEAEIEPDGWLQQLLLTSASVHRHLARRSRKPEMWLLLASSEADRSAGLVFSTPSLPVPWGVSARIQRINAILDVVEGVAIEDRAKAMRNLARSSERLQAARDELDKWQGADSRSLRSALLGLRLTAWRAALLSGDATAVTAAATMAWELVDRLTLPRDLDKVFRFEKAGAASGIQPIAERHHARATIPDRASLRPATTECGPTSRGVNTPNLAFGSRGS